MKKKNTIFKIIIGLVILAAAVVWLLSVLLPEQFKNVKLSWVLAAAFAVIALVFLFKGLLVKGLTFVKKLNIIVGGIFIVAAVLALVDQFIAAKLVLPIIAVVVALCGLLCVIAVGGKSYDTADNEKVGYKTYRERKAEEEAAEKLEELNKDNK